MPHSGAFRLRYDGFGRPRSSKRRRGRRRLYIPNIAYKTISYPVADVEAALYKALKKMDIKETKRTAEEGKISVTAVTGNLDIYIDLEKVTPTATSIEVNAAKGVFFKDKATATEIIVQTEKNLEVKK